MTTDYNKKQGRDKTIKELDLVNKKFTNTENILNMLLSTICSGFAQVNPITKEAVYKDFESNIPAVMSFGDLVMMLARTSVTESELDRYLKTYEFDSILKYLRENNGFHTETFESKGDGRQRFITINSFLVMNEDDNSEQLFSYAQDITEMEHLKKEKKYGEGFISNKLITYEANLTKDLMIYHSPKWVNSSKVEYTEIFSQLIKRVSESMVAPEFVDYVIERVSAEYLLDAYKNGARLLTIEYKRKNDSDDYEWFEQTLNVIKDEKTGDIILRCYTANINERKEKELKLVDEKQRYETMFAKAISSYEVNITKNITLKGHEDWGETFGIGDIDDYTSLIIALAKKCIHNDDKEKFLNVFGRQTVIDNFNNGINELSCEYRRINANDEFCWYRCTMHTFTDPLTGDILAFSYVEDINTEKQKELKLIYRSEHDLLTDLYNKMTAQEKIDDLLKSDELKTSKHALIMVDLDYFKDINDNFGHAFGDAVLSGVGIKMHTLFRDDDIIGRIGGDEFIILMKNVSTERAVCAKAQEICDAIRETYHHGEDDFQISASVGVAMYPRHGRNYLDLYKNSDTALYQSKYHGRNRYTVYTESMGEAETNIKDIDKDRLVVGGSNTDSAISQHVFRILYESPNKYVAINTVLELIGKYYKFSRTYVCENTYDDKAVNNTFEWCANEYESQIDNLQDVSYEGLYNYQENFNADGVFYMPDVRKMSDKLRSILEPQNIKSMVQIAIMKNDKFAGFVGFDFCDDYVSFEQDELLEYKTVANIITVFIAEMRIMQENEEAKKTALTIVNSLDSYAYVCDPKTYRTLFINEKAFTLAHNAKIGDLCYVAFWNRTEPCENCPMKALSEQKVDKYRTEMYNNNFNVWVKVTTSFIDWLGEKKVCLVDSIDITSYKNK